MTGQGTMLEIRNATIRYGGITAVRNASLRVMEGEVVTLLGANGAGKTSLLRAISGLVPCGGEILLRGKTVSALAPHERAAAGITHIPEGRGIFGNLTVAENLDLAAWGKKRGPELDRAFSAALEYFPRLKARLSQPAGTLSGGEQQMLAMGRALMSGGSLLLLDEPSMGLSPLMVQETYEILARVKEAGATMLLVEQNVHAALGIATRGYVMETGSVSVQGTREELLSNPLLKEAYLG